MRTNKNQVFSVLANQNHVFSVLTNQNHVFAFEPIRIKYSLINHVSGVSNTLTDYVNVCTTVFTPLEYGTCGLSEEDAIQQYGEDNLEVYHQNFWPLEWTVAHRPENSCYLKLICVKSEAEKVVGFHYLGPNAGEVTQGFGIALKMGATKANFDDLIGIHPTTAEVRQIILRHEIVLTEIFFRTSPRLLSPSPVVLMPLLLAAEVRETVPPDDHHYLLRQCL